MKVILPIILFSLISIVAGCQTVFDIKYTTATRGYNKEVVITPKTISIHELNSREPDKEINTTRDLQHEEWKKILQSLDGVMLREIPLLKAPSDKRTFDGAKASSITITDKKAKVWHHAFDDEDPNEKLQPLMKAIDELTRVK